jgi:hypothetical protein
LRREARLLRDEVDEEFLHEQQGLLMISNYGRFSNNKNNNKKQKTKKNQTKSNNNKQQQTTTNNKNKNTQQ